MIDQHQPCIDCGSTDALGVWDDHTYCFSCTKHTWLNKEEEVTIDTIGNLTKDTIQSSLKSNYRELSIEVLKKYGVRGNYNKEVLVSIVYPYGPKACKLRNNLKKSFLAVGDMKDTNVHLWGMDVFSPGSAECITITEGENDAMSIYSVINQPAVSVKSSATARRDCERAYNYVNSFDKIYLCFDDDEPGQKASAEVAKLFDVNKVYHVQLGGGCKDANDYLTQGKTAELFKLWRNSKRYLPKGIVNANTEVEEILRRGSKSSVATYPFPTLQEITYGIRDGELVLFTAQEGIGKTEILRAIEYHLIKTTEDGIGIIHLEEEEKRSVQGLLSYELSIPCHLPDCNVSVDDQIKSYGEMVKQDGRVNYYTHFGSDDPDTILDTIRYMVTSLHCKYIFLDHITMLVTGYEGDDERRKLDYISTRLAMLTRELKFTLFLVSHVNDEGKTRGSRNISKVADLVIHLDRDPESASFDKRNTTGLLIKKNRFSAKSGPAGFLKFDPSTYKIAEATVEQIAEHETF